ncbi:MAG: hypothetical protein WBM57_10280, partial [Woeseiaceae bacterium]
MARNGRIPNVPWPIIHYQRRTVLQKYLSLTAIVMMINFPGEKTRNTILVFLLVGVSGFPLSAVAADDSQAEPAWPGSFDLFGSDTR